MGEEEREQSKATPFVVAFLATLLVMSGVLATVVIFRTGPASATAAEEYQGPGTVYLPRREDRLNLLVAVAENSQTLPDVYLLAGFLPDKGSIALTLLPPKTLLAGGDQWSTLEDAFSRGGSAYAAKAVASYLGVPVDRHAYLELAGLRKLMESAGTFEYFMTVELDYPLHQRQVAMGRGAQQLDGRKVLDILAYPAYKGGEAERSDRGVMLVTQMVNYHLPDCLTDQGDALVKSFLNNCETNLSWKDYEERKSSTRFLAALELPAATAVYVEGQLSRDYGSFLLTESCRARLTSVYAGDGFAITPDQGGTQARLGAYEQVEEPKDLPPGITGP